jgi:hypothetical protein
VRTVDHPVGGTVVVPDVVGRPMLEARRLLSRVGLLNRVEANDASDWFTSVVATEPPAGAVVPYGSKLGLRSALPAPPSFAVCPGWPTADLPGGVDSADARPEASTVTLANVRSVVDDREAWRLRGVKGAYLARGVIRPWDRVDGEVVARDDPGYQVVVEVARRAQCPTWPDRSNVSGSPVTYVTGWPSGDEGHQLGTGQVWPHGPGIESADATVVAFAQSMLHDWTGSVVADDAPRNGPVWFTLSSDDASIRVLLVPTDHGWAVFQVGDPVVTYGSREVRFPMPGPEVREGQLWLGYPNRTEMTGWSGPLEAGHNVIEVKETPGSSLLVLVGDRGQVLSASGNAR